MDFSPPPQKTCSMCSTPTTLQCKVCACSYYCSSKCQKDDWHVHKMLCNQMQNFSTPPDEISKRAIFFPEHDKKPRFVWVKAGANNDLDVREFIGDESFGRFPAVTRNQVRSTMLANPIEIICHINSTSSFAYQPNPGIINATKGRNVSNWRGPILMLKRSGGDTKPLTYLNIDMQDFRDVVDHFTITQLSSGLADKFAAAGINWMELSGLNEDYWHSHMNRR